MLKAALPAYIHWVNNCIQMSKMCWGSTLTAFLTLLLQKIPHCGNLPLSIDKAAMIYSTRYIGGPPVSAACIRTVAFNPTLSHAQQKSYLRHNQCHATALFSCQYQSPLPGNIAKRGAGCASVDQFHLPIRRID